MLSASNPRHVGGAPQMWQKNGNSGPSMYVIVVLLSSVRGMCGERRGSGPDLGNLERGCSGVLSHRTLVSSLIIQGIHYWLCAHFSETLARQGNIATIAPPYWIRTLSLH